MVLSSQKTIIYPACSATRVWSHPVLPTPHQQELDAPHNRALDGPRLRHPDLVRTPDNAYSLANQIAQGVLPGSTVRASEAAGPQAQNDSRLQGQLDALRARPLSQFAMALNSVRLQFWGEDAGSTSREIHIEHPTIRISRNNQPATTHDLNAPAVATALLGCLGETLSNVTVTDGHLALTFANGFAMAVDPDDHYESWQINSDDGLLVVCTPGGDLSIWYPPEP
ncbi:MAG TPA: DUF6188 family protein [Pseudonocardiaceae bacterium]|jgi:hypothetical protein